MLAMTPLVRAIILLLCAVSLSAGAELVLKHGMTQVGVLSFSPSEFLPSLWRTFTNLTVLAGFSLSFAASIFWISVLSRVPLSYAYPMLSLSYAVVVFLSWLIFKEDVSTLRIVGVAVVCLGVLLVSQSA